MKVTTLAVMLSVLVPRAESADAVSVTGATVTEVGIYTAQVVKEFSVPGVVGGTNQGLERFTLVQATTNIPARIGMRFGFRYTIHGSPTNAPITLMMVGDHPPFTDPQTGRTQSRDVYPLESWVGHTYTSYSLDEKWALIPGKWRFEVWHKDKKLCEQGFVVVPDTMQGGSNKAGAANGSRPSRSETSRTPSAAAPDYTVTILKPDPRATLSRPESQPSTNLVGKSIAAIFGPLLEVRVELGGVNQTAIDGDTKKVEQKIRERIDRAKCLGRDSEVAWHKAPWARGHLLLKDGRIVPVQILLSGIVVGDWLFAEKAEQPDGAASGRRPIRAETNPVARRTVPPGDSESSEGDGQ